VCLDEAWTAVPRLDKVVAVIGLLVVASIMPGLLGEQHVGAPGATEIPVTAEGNPLKQMALAIVYALLLLVLVVRNPPSRLLHLGVPLFALLALSFASAFWSVAPAPTVRRSIALLGSVIVGMLLSCRFDHRGLLRLLLIALGCGVVLSWLHAALFPGLGLDVQGKLRGMFAHKNSFGSFLGLGLAAVAIAWMQSDPVWARSRLMLLGVAAFASLVAAQSASPIGAAAAGLGAVMLLRIIRGAKAWAIVVGPALIGLVATVALVFASDFTTIVAEVFGRDPTLSGRTTIWGFLLEMIERRLWLGYGYGVFWLGDDAPGGLFWYWHKQFELHAHNGYLTLLLDTGLIGALLFAAALSLLVRRLWLLSRLGRFGEVEITVALLVYVLIINLSETKLWQSTEILTSVFVALSMQASRRGAQVQPNAVRRANSYREATV
jgi:O-antigen ligase